MSKTASTSRKVEDAIFRQTALTGPATFYVALFDATGTELSYTGYARQSVANNTTTWGALGVVPANQIPVTFPGPTVAGPHTPATAFKLMSAASGGTAWIGHDLVTPRTPQQSVDMVFGAGDLSHVELPSS